MNVCYYQLLFLLVMVNILSISRAGWKIASWIDEWTIAVSINEQTLLQIMDTITRLILQQCS